MLKKFIKYYKPHLGLFIADMTCSLLISLCDLIYPIITRNMVKDYIPNEKRDLLIVWAIILLGVYLLKVALNYFIQYYGHLVGVRMQADMRRDIFNHLQTLPLSFFDNNKTGSLMSRITNDLMQISELAHHGPEDLFISLVMLIGSFIIMARICFPLTLILFAAVPIMIIFASIKRKKMMDAFTKTRVEIGEINATLENSISGIRVSKAYNNREYENKVFEKGNRRFVKARKYSYKQMAEFHSGTAFIGNFLQLSMYVAGGLFCYYKIIDLGDFLAFILYISIFMNPINRLISFTEQYQDGMTGFKRFCEVIDSPPEEETGTQILKNVKGDIVFEDVSFSYENNKNVLNHISFQIQAGRTLALVGPSGGGKTTICHLIPRFYEIHSGCIRIDGISIKDVQRASLRDNIGIVAQDVFLFNASIYDNISYGTPNATKEQVEEAAKRANIHTYILSLPDGYNTVVGERGVKLSGGQKQRVAIARVFLKNPPILILDEATSALDNTTEFLIQKSLDELCQGRTTLVVAHRLTTVKNADEILVITDNGIQERGNHAELLQTNGVYAALWNGIHTNVPLTES